MTLIKEERVMHIRNRPLQPDAKKIIIIGGGVAGLALATKIGKKLGRAGRAAVVLIDQNTAHVWKPMLHTFAAGTTHPYQQKIPFVAHAAQNGFRYIPGTLIDIDRGNKTITLEQMVSTDGQVLLDERTLNYDALILAAGSRANDFGTPGVGSFCLFIDNLNEAENFNRRFYEEMLRASEYGRSLDVAIVGAGATGVELAAEISQLLEIAEGYGDALRPDLKLTLIESAPRILSAFPENISLAAAELLQAMGMTIRTGARVVSADASGYILNDGTRIDAAIRVWAAGVRAPAAFNAIRGFPQSISGQVLTRATLQSVGDESVFAIGDCSSLTIDDDARPLPATAQVARQQAIHLARYLPGWLEGSSIPPFVFRDFGALVSLSRYNAFGTLARRGLFKGGFIQGRFAQLSHAMLYRLHQIELFGVRRASLIWLADAISSVVRPSVRID
nr:NAD(P)/FAD-dependent oxidoreductase [Brucella intermedia]